MKIEAVTAEAELPDTKLVGNSNLNSVIFLKGATAIEPYPESATGCIEILKLSVSRTIDEPPPLTKL